MTAPYQRIAIVGVSGAGKTTLARAVEPRRRGPRRERAALFHQPDWVELDTPTFQRRVAEFVASHDRWVADGNYRDVQATLFNAADVIVWLDLPRRQYMPALAARTLKRAITREELWNGNREHLRDVLSWDPHRSVIAWSWTMHREYRNRYLRRMRDPRWSHIPWVRCTSRDGIQRWLDSVAPDPTGTT